MHANSFGVPNLGNPENPTNLHVTRAVALFLELSHRPPYAAVNDNALDEHDPVISCESSYTCNIASHTVVPQEHRPQSRHGQQEPQYFCFRTSLHKDGIQHQQDYCTTLLPPGRSTWLIQPTLHSKVDVVEQLPRFLIQCQYTRITLLQEIRPTSQFVLLTRSQGIRKLGTLHEGPNEVIGVFDAS
ncbi:hypothetical protein CHU98_g11260 [Xylaria longipes]|nr:hypothetical protein CHU98_g11260 [Xylaria longipes]